MIRFLAVPDINPTLSRKSSVVQSSIGNLLTLTYDGTVRIDDGRREKKAEHAPIGFVSGVTPEIYRSQARRWLWLGIRRRIIPLFFTYSLETTAELQKLTREGKIHSALDSRKVLKLPERTFSVAIDERESLLIETESINFSVRLGKLAVWEPKKKVTLWTAHEIVPISPHLTLRSLAQAHARREGRGKVSEDDIKFLRKFIGYADPESPKVV